MEAGGRFPTGVRELCADSCSSATTCELDRPNRGALVCREAYFLCMLRTKPTEFVSLKFGEEGRNTCLHYFTFAKTKAIFERTVNTL